MIVICTDCILFPTPALYFVNGVPHGMCIHYCNACLIYSMDEVMLAIIMMQLNRVKIELDCCSYNYKPQMQEGSIFVGTCMCMDESALQAKLIIQENIDDLNFKS